MDRKERGVCNFETVKDDEWDQNRYNTTSNDWALKVVRSRSGLPM